MIYFKSSKINFTFLYALWMKILILWFHPSVGQFFNGFMLFKFKMLLYDLIVKIYYKRVYAFVLFLTFLHNKLPLYIYIYIYIYICVGVLGG